MRELIQAEQALGDYTRKHARHILAGVLGNNAGTVDHPTRTNFVYVRLHGDANQVIEAEAIASFPHTAGIVVAVELIKRNAASRYQVLGIASNILFVGSPWAGTVGEHAAQHQRRDLGEGGFDPLDIYNRALVNLRGRAQATPNFTLYVERGFYFIGGVLYEWTGGNSPAFTIPAGSFGVTVRRCDLLYINNVQALAIVQGATTSDGSVPPYPTTPYPCIPIAYVYLTSSNTNIQEDNIKDARVILSASDGTPVAHNLLSAIHGDTVTASVVAGDLIIGNDTPKWSRLAITVPAANVRNVVGVDNGETKPSWKTALDGTAAADVANAGAAGTSLVFSHRDHAHRGIVSVNKNGGATLYGAVTLSEGANITLTQAGQDIAIAGTAGAPLTVKEEDGAPSVANVTEIRVTNGKLTDNTGGSVSLDLSAAGGSLTVKEEDGAPSVANVTEIRVTNGKLTDNTGGSVSLDLSGTAHVIQDEGTPLTNRANLNFVGAGVTATDDAGNNATVVTIPTGGAPTTSEYITSAADGGLSAEVVIPGLAGSADIASAGGAGTSEEYDTSTTGLTWSAAPDTVDSDTTIKSHLYIKSVNNTERFARKAWAPAGAFDVRCKITVGFETGHNGGGLGLFIDNSDASNRILLAFGPSAAGPTCKIEAYTYAAAAWTQRGSTFTITQNCMYLRITRDGSNNVAFYCSTDGILWQFIATVSFTLTVANLGFRLATANSAVFYAAVDWLRTSV